MNPTKKKPCLIFFAALLSVLSVAGVAYSSDDGVRDSVAFGVKYYNDTGECSAKNGDVARVYGHDNTYFHRWDHWLSEYGYTRTEWKDKQVDERDFTTHENSGTSGVDTADAILYRGHGYYTCDSDKNKYYSGMTMGDDDNDGYGCNGSCCHQRYDQLDLGDGDANAMFSVSCHGVQKCVANKGIGNNRRVLDRMRAANQFGMFGGFHGYHYTTISDIKNHWKVFLKDAEHDGLGEEWVLEMTNRDVSGSKDNCAIAFVYGSDTADRQDYYYNSGFKDYHTVGSGRGQYWYIEGCNPGGGPEL